MNRVENESMCMKETHTKPVSFGGAARQGGKTQQGNKIVLSTVFKGVAQTPIWVSELTEYPLSAGSQATKN